MNNRKQGSNGCVDTFEDEEQIRRMVSFQVQEIVDEDRHGVPRTGTGGCIGEEEDTEGKYILERDKQNGYELESNYV